MISEEIKKLWPEIDWIQDNSLKQKVIDCWVYAVQNQL